MPTVDEILTANLGAIQSVVVKIEDMQKRAEIKTASEIADGLALIAQVNHPTKGQQSVAMCPDPVTL